MAPHRGAARPRRAADRRDGPMGVPADPAVLEPLRAPRELAASCAGCPRPIATWSRPRSSAGSPRSPTSSAPLSPADAAAARERFAPARVARLATPRPRPTAPGADRVRGRAPVDHPVPTPPVDAKPSGPPSAPAGERRRHSARGCSPTTTRRTGLGAVVGPGRRPRRGCWTGRAETRPPMRSPGCGPATPSSG